MPRFRVIIPTRDSARWVGTFLDAYRKAGIEPLYIVDTRSADSTLQILQRKGADWRSFTPLGDFVEAGMMEFGARNAGVDWLLRVDDDEFPSRALLRWMASTGIRSLNQAWHISIRTLFVHEDRIYYSRSPGHFAHPQAADYLHPHLRLFCAERIAYRNRVHTSGFRDPVYSSFAPQDAFLIHCNCLVRTPAERWQKIQKYEVIAPGSTYRLADEYLPELYDLEFHDARRDGLDEFAQLIAALPIAPTASPLELDAETKILLKREVSRLQLDLRASRSTVPVTSADSLAWLHSVPRGLWKPAAALLRAFGGARLRDVSVAIENYQKFFSPVEVGDVIAFSDPRMVSKFMPEGWSEAETTGVWSEGEGSVIALKMAKPLSEIRLIFDLRPFAEHGNAQETALLVNDRECDVWRFETGERRSLPVEATLPAPTDRIIIRLRHRRPVSPHQLGVGADERRLAIFLYRLTVAPAQARNHTNGGEL